MNMNIAYSITYIFLSLCLFISLNLSIYRLFIYNTYYYLLPIYIHLSLNSVYIIYAISFFKIMNKNCVLLQSSTFIFLLLSDLFKKFHLVIKTRAKENSFKFRAAERLFYPTLPLFSALESSFSTS